LVVVTTNGGDPIAQVPLPVDREFALEYQHSVYAALVTESFEAFEDGTFALVAVSSPSEAVLDYYEVEGTRSRDGGWWRERLTPPTRFERLGIVGTPVGRRTLTACGQRVPLYTADGPSAHITLRVEFR
jgi:hypothetical protein